MTAIFLALAIGSCMVWLELTRATPENIPELRDGDVVLHTSGSGQSLAILMATRSLYTHMGIVHITRHGPVIVEAASVVMQTPLKDWIKRGRWGRLTILRKKELSPQKADEVVSHAASYVGRLYDPYFSMGTDRIYCSELVWLAFKEAGIKVGKIEKVGDLALNSMPVKKVIEQRWKKYPACHAQKIQNFPECWEKILEGTIVTPASIADDTQFGSVYSNYF
ncbi:MAG: YiiX/YebB-like N1pC/P60 family cysteine hydrolase [Pseudobdellovibrionaceae bacterium]